MVALICIALMASDVEYISFAYLLFKYHLQGNVSSFILPMCYLEFVCLFFIVEIIHMHACARK